MSDNKKITRPISITLISIIAYIAGFCAFPVVFESLANRYGIWYPLYLGFDSLAGMACAVGLWRMKQLAVYGYIAFFLLFQVVMLVLGNWSPYGLIVPLVVIAFALKHVSKMSPLPMMYQSSPSST